MTFHEAEQYMLSLLNLPRSEYMKDPKHCGVYLERLQFFLDILGNPEKQIPHYIHIAGTSGKGSMTTALHHILLASGKKVGMLQSPHPTHVRERWTVGKSIMTKKEYTDIATVFKKALDIHARTYSSEMISYSEMKTAFGLYYFAKKNVEWCVMETGCGGRYDSTNIIPHKDVAIITNIGLDHVGIIGNNKEEIAYEKAGIISRGTTVFTMEQKKHIRKILETEAQKKQAQFHYLPKQYTIQNQSLDGTQFTYNDANYTLRSIGGHQAYNATLAIEVAKHIGISQTHIKKGLLEAVQPIRMEVVKKQPYIILDGAHNDDKIASTVHAMQAVTKSSQRIHLVFGLSGDKKLLPILKQLYSLSPRSIACTRNTSNLHRKVHAPSTIVKTWKKLNKESNIEQFLDPKDALDWAITQAKKNDIILVTGSVFLAGELRGRL